MLLGRRNERDVLERLLVEARGGEGGAIVVLGEPGIGKTALIEHAVTSARDFQMLRTVGIEAEVELAYGALQQLCKPGLDKLDRLPGPQRDALGVVFGLTTGSPPDRLLVALAVLTLLSELAAERPLLGLVDDAQWLDQASAHAIAFVAHRSATEPLALVFGARALTDELGGLPELIVEGLGDDDARALLGSVLPYRLDERVRERIIAETRGNPLALLELPRGQSQAQLAGGFGLPPAVSLSASIEETFTRRLATLPGDARRLLLVAAADPTGDRALVWRAAEQLGIPDSAPRTVESESLLALSPRVVFRHPLVRSAVYGAASPHEKRDAHHALAQATDPAIDPDRRAWHRALAASAPDEETAAELERSAGRAQARGGFAAAAAFLERAVALTGEPSYRARRSLAAAQAKFEAGSLDDALGLLEAAESGPGVADAMRAQVHQLRGQIAFASRRGSDAAPLLLAAARELEAVEPSLARATYLEALSAAVFAGRLARGGSVVAVSEAALAGPAIPQTAGPSDLLLQGLAVRFTQGYVAGARRLKEALNAFQREAVLPPKEARWLWFASQVALFMWDDAAWTALSTRQLELVRQAGALSALPFVLTDRISVAAFLGDLGTAASLEEELRAVTEATGIATAAYGRLSIAALRGREAEFSELIRTTVGEAEARGEGLALTVTEFLSGVLYNGLGRYEAALAAVLPAEQFYAEGPALWALTELIEAAVRCGQPERAQRALEHVEEATRAAGTDWAMGIEARSRALLSHGDDAERLYGEAIERLRRTSIRVQLARTHLLYGEWLRRQGRRIEAREQLRTAHELFSDFGVEGFAERARVELQATGEHARKRTVETSSDLTPQEAQISELVARGATNQEIAAQMFISPSTVEYHLRKVFKKLGLKSRTQLAHRIIGSTTRHSRRM